MPSSSFQVSSPSGPMLTAYPNGTCACGSFAGSGASLTHLDQNPTITVLQTKLNQIQVTRQDVSLCGPSYSNCDCNFSTTTSTCQRPVENAVPGATPLAAWPATSSPCLCGSTYQSIEQALNNLTFSASSTVLSITAATTTSECPSYASVVKVYILWA